MSKRLLSATAAAVLAAFSAGVALAEDRIAEDATYPRLATIDGTAASLAGADAALFEVSPPLTVDSYDPGTSADVVAEEHNSPPNNFKRTMWAYEAAPSGSRILEYQIGPRGGPPLTPGPTCVPKHLVGFPVSQNGRGLAWDPLTDLLLNTHVDVAFRGDGYIHRNTHPADVCDPRPSLPFGDGPGGTIQDDIGAIDVDEATMNWWVAGYKPVSVRGSLLSYLYKVNRNTGQIIDSCAIPFRGGGVGNDSLAVYRNPSLPGSSKLLLTDAGHAITGPNTFALIDQADCHGGNVVRPVKEFPKTTPGGVSGIDMEWPGLLNANPLTGDVHNNGDQPFDSSLLLGNGGGQLVDISLCGYRAAYGGDGNDGCTHL